jgi:hypothetical protein
MDTTTRIAALRARQAKIQANANERIATIAAKANEGIANLELKISDMSRPDVIKANKLAAIEAEADAIAQEDRLAYAQTILDQRKAMAARGEDIYVPRDAAEMLAILTAMEV